MFRSAATVGFRMLRQQPLRRSSNRMPPMPPCGILGLRSPALVARSNHTLAVKTRFTKDHEWLVVDNHGVGTIGITEYAQKALGDVVFVELPIIGDTVKKNDQIGTIESVKAANDMYTPISGDIFLVNEKLTAYPSLINKSPEVDGWWAQIKIADMEETESDDLMDEDAYAAYCEEASKKEDK